LVRTALRAAAERLLLERRVAALLVCFDSAEREAVLRGSPFKTLKTARETRGLRVVFRLPCPAS
jgi:hypothetical protein